MLWKFNVNSKNIYWFSIPLLYCITLEFLQKTHITDGTYDANDLIYYVLATLIFFIVNVRNFNNLSSSTATEMKHKQSAFTLVIFLGIVILSDCF
ncbi:MAG: hypothetical protein ACO3E1_08360 [Flavobacteriales bacterium]